MPKKVSKGTAEKEVLPSAATTDAHRVMAPNSRTWTRSQYGRWVLRAANDRKSSMISDTSRTGSM